MTMKKTAAKKTSVKVAPKKSGGAMSKFINSAASAVTRGPRNPTVKVDRLEKLTPEQEARLPEIAKECIAAGLSTERIDKKRVRAALKLAYAAAKLPCPKQIEFYASPWQGMKRVQELGVSDYYPFFGSHEMGWVSLYVAFREMGVKCVDEMEGLIQLAYEAGWVWFFDQLVIVTDRPVEIHLDAEGRLHHPSKKAIVYSDGWGLCEWHGVRVPDKVILTPELLTVKEIDQEPNAEVKRVMMEKFGFANYLEKSGAKEISRDEFGILYQKKVPNDEPLTMVKVMNSTPEPDGSIKPYYLRVDPRCRPLFENNQRGAPQAMTPRNAVASTFGLRGEEYNPAEQT